MARQYIFVDDVDGSPADRTITVTVDGRTYELDLSEKNAAQFENSIGQWLDLGRKVRSTGAARRARPKAGSGTEENKRIREWANKNGFQVSPRGNISGLVREAYAAARQAEVAAQVPEPV